MYTSKMLVEWAEKALAKGAKYWYGTCWYEADEGLLNRKKKQYPSHYTESRMSTYRKHISEGRMVCDCVGLIKGFFWTSNGTTANKYKANNCPDTSANGMIKLCEETWDIKDMPDEPGLVVWCSGHIGIYVGNGYAIEARGYKYGVVRTKVASRTWTKAGRLPSYMLKHSEETKPATDNKMPTIKKGATGDAVRTAQKLLITWNPDALPKYGADGDFGSETDKWVKRFQKANGLEVDGIVGKNTWAALNAVLI